MCHMLKVEWPSTLTLKASRDRLEKVRDYANKRASFGERNFLPLCDRIASLSEEEYFKSLYHSGFYKGLVSSVSIA